MIEEDTILKAMHCHKSQKADAEWILSMMEGLPKEEHFLVLQKN